MILAHYLRRKCPEARLQVTPTPSATKSASDAFHERLDQYGQGRVAFTSTVNTVFEQNVSSAVGHTSSAQFSVEADVWVQLSRWPLCGTRRSSTG